MLGQKKLQVSGNRTTIEISFSTWLWMPQYTHAHTVSIDLNVYSPHFTSSFRLFLPLCRLVCCYHACCCLTFAIFCASIVLTCSLTLFIGLFFFWSLFRATYTDAQLVALEMLYDIYACVFVCACVCIVCVKWGESRQAVCQSKWFVYMCTDSSVCEQYSFSHFCPQSKQCGVCSHQYSEQQSVVLSVLMKNLIIESQ